MSRDLIEALPIELQALVLRPDTSIPPIKDIRKCLRKLPLLDEIEWIGRHSRGSWKITRFDGKRCSCWGIEFHHSAWRYTDLWTSIKSNGHPVWDFGDIVLDDAVADAPDDRALDLESIQATPSLAHLSISSSESSLMTMVRQWSQSSSAGEFEDMPMIPSSLENSPSISGGVSSAGQSTKKSAASSGTWRSPKAASMPASPESSKGRSRAKTGHENDDKARKPVGERRRERKNAAEATSAPLGMAPRPSDRKSDPIKGRSRGDTQEASSSNKGMSYARAVSDDCGPSRKGKGRKTN